MTHDLVRRLQKAGVPCRALSAWCRCRDEDGEQDCETCWLDGPLRCDSQVVEALVERLVHSTQQTDRAIQQRAYWEGVCSRLSDTVMRLREA